MWDGVGKSGATRYCHPSTNRCYYEDDAEPFHIQYEKGYGWIKLEESAAEQFGFAKVEYFQTLGSFTGVDF